MINSGNQNFPSWVKNLTGLGFTFNFLDLRFKAQSDNVFADRLNQVYALHLFYEVWRQSSIDRPVGITLEPQLERELGDRVWKVGEGALVVKHVLHVEYVLLRNPRELERQLLDHLGVDSVLNQIHWVVSFRQDHFGVILRRTRLWNGNTGVHLHFKHRGLQPSRVDNVEVKLNNFGLVGLESSYCFELYLYIAMDNCICNLVVHETHFNSFVAQALRSSYFEGQHFLVPKQLVIPTVTSFVFFCLDHLWLSLVLVASSWRELVWRFRVHFGSNPSFCRLRKKLHFLFNLGDVKVVEL